MSIGKKLLMGFGLIVILLLVVMMISFVSSQSIKTEGETIVDQAKDARIEYTEFTNIDTFEADLKDMIQYVLRLGYVTNAQEREEMYVDYQKLFQAIVKLAQENGFYSILETELKGLNDNVEEIFAQKTAELAALTELSADKSSADEIRTQLEDLYKQKDLMLKRDDMNFVKFIQKLQQIRQSYSSPDQRDESLESQIKEELEKTDLNKLTFVEMDMLWDTNMLGGPVIPELSLIMLYARELMATDGHYSNFSSNMKQAKEDVLAFIDEENQDSYFTYDVVTSVFIPFSVEKYEEKLKVLQELLLKISRMEVNLQAKDNMVGYHSQTAEQARINSLNRIKNELSAILDGLNVHIGQMIDDSSNKFNDNINQVEKKSQDSVALINQMNSYILIVLIGSVLISIIIAFVIYTSIKKPIRSILKKTERMKDLDFSVDFEEIKKNDEMGQLDKALEEIVFAVKDTVENVKKAIDEVKGLPKSSKK